MITCNIISSFPHRLARQLKTHVGYFDKVRVVYDENNPYLSDIINRYQGIESIKTKWIGCDLVRNLLSGSLEVGEWAFILDDDDILSQPLLDNMYEAIDNADRKHLTSIAFPFVNEFGNLEFQATYPQITFNASATRDYSVLSKWIKNYNAWFAQRAYKVNVNKIRFTGGQHPCTPDYGLDRCYLSIYHIIHTKRFADNFLTPLWIGITGLLENPQTDYYGWTFENLNEKDPKIGAELYEIIQSINANPDVNWLIAYLKNGNIDSNLRKWIWKYKERNNCHIYSIFMLYFLHYHPEELPEGYYNRFLFQYYLQFMIPEGYASLKTEQLPIHALLKKHLFLLGMTEIERKV